MALECMDVLPCPGQTSGQDTPQCTWTRRVSPLCLCARGPYTVADTTQLSSQHVPVFKDLELCPQHRGRAHVSCTWAPCMPPPIPDVTFQLKTYPRAPPCFRGGQQSTPVPDAMGYLGGRPGRRKGGMPSSSGVPRWPVVSWGCIFFGPHARFCFSSEACPCT